MPIHKKMPYRTKQKQLVLQFLANHPNTQFSAKEIAMRIQEVAEIGDSTVYRLIKNMTESGELRRFHGKNGKSVVYQYTDKTEHCHEHFHLKCTDCGEFIHLDCDLIKSFEEHCTRHHGFVIDPMKTVFYGLCEPCARKKQEVKA